MAASLGPWKMNVYGSAFKGLIQVQETLGKSCDTPDAFSGFKCNSGGKNFMTDFRIVYTQRQDLSIRMECEAG